VTAEVQFGFLAPFIAMDIPASSVAYGQTVPPAISTAPKRPLENRRRPH
jgi:hypothetical protein